MDVFFLAASSSPTDWAFVGSGIAGTAPWFVMLLWAIHRSRRKGATDLDWQLAGTDLPFWLILLWGVATAFGGIAVGYYATAGVFAAFHVPADGRTFDLWASFAIGNFWMISFVGVGLWVSRDLWLHVPDHPDPATFGRLPPGEFERMREEVAQASGPSGPVAPPGPMHPGRHRPWRGRQQ